MLRTGRTGHTWHLVVDHIMLVMKRRSSSPVNRPVKRIYVHVQKEKRNKRFKKKKKSGYLQPAISSDWRKLAVNCYCQKKIKKLCLSVDLLNDYTRGDQKVRGKVLLNRIAFIDCNENS